MMQSISLQRIIEGRHDKDDELIFIRQAFSRFSMDNTSNSKLFNLWGFAVFLYAIRFYIHPNDYFSQTRGVAAMIHGASSGRSGELILSIDFSSFLWEPTKLVCDRAMSSIPYIQRCFNAFSAVERCDGSTTSNERIKSCASFDIHFQSFLWNWNSPCLILWKRSRCLSSMNGGYPTNATNMVTPTLHISADSSWGWFFRISGAT